MKKEINVYRYFIFSYKILEAIFVIVLNYKTVRYIYSETSLVRSQGNWDFYTNYPKLELKRFLKNTEGKGEIARNEQFLLFHQCFSLYGMNEIPSILITREIVVCKLLLFETN